MPNYLIRKVETYHYLLEADSEDAAREQAEALLEFDWEQSDGPTLEVELADTEETS